MCSKCVCVCYVHISYVSYGCTYKLINYVMYVYILRAIFRSPSFLRRLPCGDGLHNKMWPDITCNSIR